MSFDWVTFGFQLVNVLVLLAILQHFLFRPVADIIAKRQAETQEALRRAEAAELDAEAAERAAEAAKHQTEAARHDVLTAAQDEAEAQRKAILDAARTEAVSLAQKAAEQAQAAVTGAAAETLARARDLAEVIARRAVSAQPVPPDGAGYAARLAQALAGLPDDQRAAILAGANLRLAAPAPLSAAEQTAVCAALGLEKAGFELDQSLIAGLELRSDTGLVHNSLAHDLDQIARALTAEAAA